MNIFIPKENNSPAQSKNSMIEQYHSLSDSSSMVEESKHIDSYLHENIENNYGF